MIADPDPLEVRLVSPRLHDALLEASMELSILLHDKRSGEWLAYGCFPGGSGDYRLSSPVGHGKTPDGAVEALLRLKTPHRPSWGLLTRLWACGEAMGALARAVRR